MAFGDGYVPVCSCGREMRNWRRALFMPPNNLRMPANYICRQCYHDGLHQMRSIDVGVTLQGISLVRVARPLFRLLDDSVNLNLLRSFRGRIDASFPEFFSTSGRPNKAVASLALVYSIQDADEESVFPSPSRLIKMAMEILFPPKARPIHLYRLVYLLLMNKELWVPLDSKQKGVEVYRRRMRLGEKVLKVMNVA